MRAAMDRLERFVTRRRRLVLGVWIVLVVAAVPFAAQQTKHLTAGGFEVPGSGSQAVSEALKRFPGVQTEPLILVFDNSKKDPAALAAAIDKAQQEVQGIPNVAVSPAAAAAAKAAGDQPIVLLALDVKGGADSAVDAAVDLRKNLHIQDNGNLALPVHLVGQQALWAGLQDVSKKDLEKAEFAGFPVVFIILLAVFGSLAAALLPFSLGVAAVVLTGAAVYFLSQTLQMSVFVTNIASMLGIGVAVDYSLFILSRYREELHGGADPETARATAMRTSGLAVFVSGVTVVISLAGLFLIDSKTMRSMAIGAIVVVAIAVLAAMTLLPVLIKTLGARVYEPGRGVSWVRGKLSGLRPARPHDDRPPFWDRWTARIMRRPVLFASLATATLLIIAIPALSLKWGTAALGQLPKDNETRIGFEQAAQAAGPGALGPVLVVADGGDRAPDAAAVEKYRAAVQQLPGVAAVSKPTTVVRRARRADQRDAQGRPRERRGRGAGQAPARAERPGDHPAGRRVNVGGAAAQNHDFSDLISGSLWKILLFVLAFSYVVLLFVLRSVLLPLKAVIMNVLSVAAAYGVLVMVFQYGWTDSIIGFDHLGLRQRPDTAAAAGHRLRPVDGLRGLPALAHPRALLRDRRQPRSRCRRAWPPARRRSRAPRSSWSRSSRSSRSPACRRSRRSASASPWRSSSTRRSCASYSSRPRWSSWASGTGGCPTGWTASCPTWTSRAAASRWSSTPTPSRRSSPPSLRVRPLEVATWPDFARLVERHNGVWGGAGAWTVCAPRRTGGSPASSSTAAAGAPGSPPPR